MKNSAKVLSMFGIATLILVVVVALMVGAMPV
jgi:hypothetical protein